MYIYIFVYIYIFKDYFSLYFPLVLSLAWSQRVSQLHLFFHHLAASVEMPVCSARAPAVLRQRNALCLQPSAWWKRCRGALTFGSVAVTGQWREFKWRINVFVWWEKVSFSGLTCNLRLEEDIWPYVWCVCLGWECLGASWIDMILIQRARIQQSMIIIDGDKCKLYLPTYFPAPKKNKTNQNKTIPNKSAPAAKKIEIVSEYSKSLENIKAVLIHK